MGVHRTCIVPVEPASGHGVLVLLEVHQDGTHPLDVRLVGCHCEDDSPQVYKTTVEQHNVGKLKHKFKGSDDEWTAVLSHFLLQEEPGQGLAVLDGVRMVYTLNKDNLELTIRQHVQAIKVTLGEIVLPRDDDFEFDPFEWAKTATRAHYKALQELAHVKARAIREQDTITKLNAQLEEFIKTKNEAETAMLQQFMELLNEKKRKIRDQSRLLAGAKVNKATATAIQSARAETKPQKRKPTTSRKSKRKVLSRAKPGSDSDSDQMEIDEFKAEEHDDDEVVMPESPDRDSDDETDVEDETDLILQANERLSARLRSSSVQPSKEKEEMSGPPPPRALPFNKTNIPTRGKTSEMTPSSPASDGDDETKDEEL